MSFVFVESLRILQEAYVGHNEKTSGRLNDRAKLYKEASQSHCYHRYRSFMPTNVARKECQHFQRFESKQTGGFGE